MAEGAAIIVACVQDFIGQFLAANVNVQALGALADCSFQGGEGDGEGEVLAMCTQGMRVCERVCLHACVYAC